MLVQLKDGSYDVARLYKGILDGNEFADWYDKADFDFTSPVTHWQPLPSPPKTK
jgi:hypothetical protein